MKLNVSERLVTVGVLPEKGNFKTMNTVENVKKVLHLSEEEVIEYELKQTGEVIGWNKKGAEKTEVIISELGFELIMESFEKLDKESNLTIHQFPVFKYLKEVKEEMDNPKEKPKDKK